MDDNAFTRLTKFIATVPATTGPVGCGAEEDGRWWVKFSIDIGHNLAWHTVQESGHVLNYLSVDERLPISFHPVSPPPYMNGGPEDFLSWHIECHSAELTPDKRTKWLSGRLPNPVGDESEWLADFPEKTDSAWTSEQVIILMVESLANGDFYILCPDNDVTRDQDNKQMAWAMGHGRPYRESPGTFSLACGF